MPLTKPRQALVTSKFWHDGRQPERVVHGDRGRRLEVRAADRGVDHQPDLGGVDAGLGDRLAAGHGGAVDEGDAVGPPAALADAGEPLEQPGPQADPAVGVGEPLVERVGGDHLGGVDGVAASTAVLLKRWVVLPVKRMSRLEVPGRARHRGLGFFYPIQARSLPREGPRGQHGADGGPGGQHQQGHHREAAVEEGGAHPGAERAGGQQREHGPAPPYDVAGNTTAPPAISSR